MLLFSVIRRSFAGGNGEYAPCRAVRVWPPRLWSEWPLASPSLSSLALWWSEAPEEREREACWATTAEGWTFLVLPRREDIYGWMPTSLESRLQGSRLSSPSWREGGPFSAEWVSHRILQNSHQEGRMGNLVLPELQQEETKMSGHWVLRYCWLAQLPYGLKLAEERSGQTWPPVVPGIWYGESARQAL